jgi:hypothetical protein
MENEPQTRPGSRRLAAAIAALVAAVVIGVPLVLHFGQKSHNELPFDIAEIRPEDREFASGEIFGATLVAIVQHELSGITGWRPNDLFIWGPTLWADNNSNRQLGIIQATREYDENLVRADTMLRNDEFKWWFPSAERRFGQGTEALRDYLAGLRAMPPTSKPINRRNVELIRLFQAWTDLLGGAHADLYRDDASYFRIDDYFYKAQGFAHVMFHLTEAVKREYAVELRDRLTVLELLGQVSHSLGRAASLKPVFVLDGGADGLFANHRRNLDAYIVDARQLMYSIREELEK